MFFNMLVKHVMDFQELILQGEWEKFAILSLVNETKANKENNIRKWMHGFVGHLLLNLGQRKSLGNILE